MFKETVGLMTYFSRVARRPVWFTYEELWDLMSEAQVYGGKKVTQSFPSKTQFGHFVSWEKKVSTKQTSENYLKVRRYAYIHANQSPDGGVDYNGGMR